MIFGGRVSFLPTSVDRTARLLHARMLAIHPQLAGYRVEYSWGGNVALTMDRMPHIGRTKAGVMFAMGYSGTGVVMSTWLGTRAAEWMGGGAPPALARLKFPLVLAPYEGRPGSCRSSAKFRWQDRLAVRGVPPPEAGADRR
jgi:glycine/D-amino acid oxidase-like deaminating enzyme